MLTAQFARGQPARPSRQAPDPKQQFGAHTTIHPPETLIANLPETRRKETELAVGRSEQPWTQLDVYPELKSQPLRKRLIALRSACYDHIREPPRIRQLGGRINDTKQEACWA